MKVYLINFIISLAILTIFTNCEDAVEIDTTPPVVSIQSPLSGTKVSEIGVMVILGGYFVKKWSVILIFLSILRPE